MGRFVAACLQIVFFGLAPVLGSQPPSPSLPTIDSLIDIKHPSQASWSPDSRRVAFVWDRAGVQDVRVVETQIAGGSLAPRPLTSFESGLVDGLFWSKDGRTLFFGREGDLWQASPDGGRKAQAAWTTEEVESEIALSPDGTHVAFVRGGTRNIPAWQRNEGDLWVRSLADGREVRLTNSPAAVESDPVWSPDGTRLAFTVTGSVRREEAPEYSGAKILYTSLERSPSDVAVVPAAGGSVTTAAGSPDSESAPRWVDGSQLVLERMSADVRTREILLADATSGEGRLLHRDVDAKFWSMMYYVSPEPLPSPDSRWVAFLSDRDGWDHLYVIPSSGGSAIQVTRGPYEVRNIAWSPDSTRIAFDTNQGANPGVRQLAVTTLGRDPAAAQVRLLTAGGGTNTGSVWAPDGRHLVYQHTDPQNSADLFVVGSEAAAQEKAPLRLTDSMPAGIDRSAFVEPQFVSYPAPDGKRVPAYLFVPKGLDRSRKHPGVVWIHGDGINQNYDGWHVQRNYAVYYSFHQYLVQRGYVVLAPDYRGSIGYGKEWRQGVYLEVGGKDYQDVPPAVDYLKTLGFVDTDRLGVWGLSYGGFFTLLALTDRPTLFRCGVDVAGPVDYRMYYQDPYKGDWTVGRMGSPAEHPEVYRVAAPIERVDRIERPLLVLHPTADVNVPYLHSVLLIDQLLKLGKDVEFMMYPGEFHYFHRAHILRDAWRRVERFFDTHLRAASAVSDMPDQDQSGR